MRIGNRFVTMLGPFLLKERKEPCDTLFKPTSCGSNAPHRGHAIDGVHLRRGGGATLPCWFVRRRKATF